MGAIARESIARWLPGNSTAAKTLHKSLSLLESWSSQTYEGKPISTAIGITGSVGHGDVAISEVWNDDFAKVLGNGFDSLFLCGRDGRVFNVKYLPPQILSGFFPARLSAIAEWTRSSNRVALVLNRNGEILVLSNGRLQFARRSGRWHYFPHTSIVSRFGFGRKTLKTAIYESLLDVSFSRTGGCVALMKATHEPDLGKLVKEADLLATGQTARTKLLKSTIDKKFQELDRRFRQELLALDGATILSHDGRVVAAGAIVQVP
jgi:hypothetical protein